MNTTELKNYAPQARKDFIAAVTARAAQFGVTANNIEPITEQGDVALIGDKAYPRSVAANRKKLEDRIHQQGFDQVMEAMAYTWFNRFMAIRYMELHGYLDHGRRVLSHPEKTNGFEILDACTEIVLPGVDRDQVVELKLDGSKDEELYRILLLGQCHALHQAMPFLFEAIEDETELLLPDNLTKTDSLIRHLVDDIPEDNWQQVEIIGWLYQFYISEKKGEVIGKVVASEDIPAATQLFTPNWIVKYMVQNSLGAQWLATYPESKLKEQMEYYIEPAEQTDEVNAQLAAITPSTLNPEELTLIDPASGSGHILVEAYELFKAIYLERGYRKRDVAQLILEKNLFGLEICGRAAQLTGFALMMKGRADDRRLFEWGVKLNVMALQDSAGFDAERLAQGVILADYELQSRDLTELKRLFEHATTFGSLIQVAEELATKLPALKQLCEASSQDLFVSEALKRLEPLVQQAELLAAQYDALVTNPPYMGSKGMNALVKKFTKDHFPDSKSDLFACFVEQASVLVLENSRYSLITMPSWLFLGSFKKLREKLFSTSLILSLLHMGRGIFGIDFGSAAFVVQKTTIAKASGRFFRLHKRNFQHIHIPDIARLLRRSLENSSYCYDFESYRSSEMGGRIPTQSMEGGEQIQYSARQSDFKKIPGSPVAYWLPPIAIQSYSIGEPLGQICYGQPGLQTSNNDLFVRLWTEVPQDTIGVGFTSSQEAKDSGKTWMPYLKGGDYRKWYGNQTHVVNWRNDGEDIKHYVNVKYSYLNGNIDYVVKDRGYFFKRLISYSKVTSVEFSARAAEAGFVFDVAGSSVFPDREDYWLILGFLCSRLANFFVRAQNPTVNLQSGDIDKLPIMTGKLRIQSQTIEEVLERLLGISKHDWNIYERSWDFQSLPILTASTEPTPTLESSYTTWIIQNREAIAEMKRLEEENNRLFIDAYGLGEELTPDVPIAQITLTVNPAYRYGGKLTEKELWTRFHQDTMEELVSYAIGCMMGRYSLDAPGLIYAHGGNEGFDSSRYNTFPADDDGIVPITDTDWFADDACNRVVEFMSVAWDKTQLEENLSFLAENLSPKMNQSSRETIRSYLCNKFFKDHLKTYKKRPIYWLFSSGKQKAFQCLVYLHRYNEGTLARMRTEYVIPLQGKMSSRIEQLDNDIASASSTAHRKKLERERDLLSKQRVELQQFDEKLRHCADQRISLDLDDGVKVNYDKFGDLLAEVKAVAGKKAV